MIRRDGWLCVVSFLVTSVLLAISHSAALAPLVAGL